jgi:hypothetical protein
MTMYDITMDEPQGVSRSMESYTAISWSVESWVSQFRVNTNRTQFSQNITLPVPLDTHTLSIIASELQAVVAKYTDLSQDVSLTTSQIGQEQQDGCGGQAS